MFTSTDSGILRFPRQIAISALSITVNWVRTFIRGTVGPGCAAPRYFFHGLALLVAVARARRQVTTLMQRF